MSRAFQCDICKSLYCNKKNKDTDSYFNPKVFKLRNKEVSLYEYNENLYGYTKKGRVVYRYGDNVLVHCISSDPDKRQVDFALVRKI